MVKIKTDPALGPGGRSSTPSTATTPKTSPMNSCGWFVNLQEPLANPYRPPAVLHRPPVVPRSRRRDARHKEPVAPGGKYPFRLTGGHTRWSMHSIWRANDAAPAPSARRAGGLHLREGRRERAASTTTTTSGVYNDVGGFEIRAKVSPAVQPGRVDRLPRLGRLPVQGLGDPERRCVQPDQAHQPGRQLRPAPLPDGVVLHEPHPEGSGDRDRPRGGARMTATIAAASLTAVQGRPWAPGRRDGPTPSKSASGRRRSRPSPRPTCRWRGKTGPTGRHPRRACPPLPRTVPSSFDSSGRPSRRGSPSTTTTSSWTRAVRFSPPTGRARPSTRWGRRRRR